MVVRRHVASARRAEYVGLANYREALGVDRTARGAPAVPEPWLARGGRSTDPLVYRSLGNSLTYTAMLPLVLLFLVMERDLMRGLGVLTWVRRGREAGDPD